MKSFEIQENFSECIHVESSSIHKYEKCFWEKTFWKKKHEKR